MSNLPANRPVDEDVAALILDRAAKLDAERGSRLDVAALRAAALEAGISPESFERALAEVEAAQGGGTTGTVKPEAGVRVSSTLYRVGILAAGLGISAVGVFLQRAFGLDDAPAMLFSLIVGGFTAIGLMLKRRRDRAVLDFGVDFGLLWLGFTLVWLAADPSNDDRILAAMGVIGGIAAALGAGIIALPRQDEPKALPEVDGAKG